MMAFCVCSKSFSIHCHSMEVNVTKDNEAILERSITFEDFSVTFLLLAKQLL